MGGKVGENPAALRAAVFSLASKNLRGVFKRPPPQQGAGYGGFDPRSPPPPVSAPDEDSMIVEDLLTHNFMPNPDRTTKGRVLRRSAKCEQELEMILF